MFTRIAIDNYRCFSNFELQPGRINLLLGANGSGKSSFFDLLNAVVDLVRKGVEVDAVMPTSSLTRWDKRDRQRVEIEIEGRDGAFFEYTLVVRHDREQGRGVIASESLTLDGRKLFAFSEGLVFLFKGDGSGEASFSFRGNRSFLAQVDPHAATNLAWFLGFLDEACMVRLDARRIPATSHGEDAVLSRDGSNFASWYRQLAQERPERLQDLWASWQSAIPGLETVRLVSAGGQGRARDLVAHMITGGASHDIEFSELSDGQRALMVLYTLLAGWRPSGGCLLLDEPEAHVGLTEVQPWLVALDERVTDAGQVFVISQHPEVVDYLAASEPFIFERPDAGPSRARPAVFDRACGLPASQQIARGLDDGE